jgi:hypothetical protein
MKKQLILLLTTALVLPVLSQETNEVKQRDEKQTEERKSRSKDGHSDYKNRPERSNRTEEQRKAHAERKYQFMDKALSEIGISDEDKVKIQVLQQEHREKMKGISERTEAARKKLSDLQNSGATEVELDAAIDEVTQTQGEQLKLLVRNRMGMERILGKEKCGQLMDAARKQYRKKGNRGGPGLPPLPGGAGDVKPSTPPLPDSAAKTSAAKSKAPPIPDA